MLNGGSILLVEDRLLLLLLSRFRRFRFLVNRRTFNCEIIIANWRRRRRRKGRLHLVACAALLRLFRLLHLSALLRVLY